MDINRCKLSIVSLLLITCSLVLLTSSIAIAAKERRIALVIGNGAYKSSPLGNPVNDANDMAAALKKLGFSVRLKINANQRSMENSIRTFGKDLRSGGVGLFFFAGHGLQVHGRNYLIPIGADIGSEADVKYESVDAGRVLSQMYEAENGLNIIILDACRDNPYARSFRSSEIGLAKMDAPTGSILAYATAPDSVAADGTGRNGLYTSMLLKHMMEPNLIIERVFKKVRVDVMKESASRQVPWESSSLTGDFYFYSKRGIVVKKQSTVKPEKPIKKIPKYTSISPEVSKKIERSDPRFKLAIFPFYLGNMPKYNVDEQKDFSNFVIKLTNSMSNIITTHSVYPYDSYIANHQIVDISKLNNDKTVKNIWYGDSSYAKNKPDFNALKELSEQINSDLILIFRVELDIAGNKYETVSYKGYIIDVKKRIYYKKMAYFENIGVADFGKIEDITKDLFEIYQNSNSQMSTKY